MSFHRMSMQDVFNETLVWFDFFEPTYMNQSGSPLESPPSTFLSARNFYNHSSPTSSALYAWDRSLDLYGLPFDYAAGVYVPNDGVYTDSERTKFAAFVKNRPVPNQALPAREPEYFSSCLMFFPTYAQAAMMVWSFNRDEYNEEVLAEFAVRYRRYPMMVLFDAASCIKTRALSSHFRLVTLMSNISRLIGYSMSEGPEPDLPELDMEDEQ